MAPFQFGNSDLPEVVKYIEFGREDFAFPIGARSLAHHDGLNDEPMLSLVVVRPVLDPLDPDHQKTLSLAGTSRESELVKIIHDVAHESHEFTPAQLEAIGRTGVTVSQVYPGGKIVGGRWRELSSTELSVLKSKAVQREQYYADKAAAAQAEADKAKAAAEKAEADKPKPLDDITREALIRNKQAELKSAAEAPKAPDSPKPPDPSEGSGTVQ